MIGIQWIDRVDRYWLKKLIGYFAKPGVPFELHCWNEETEAISLAKSIAQPRKTDWQHGVYFKGVATEEKISVITMISDGEEATPFFDILINDDLICEHWGREIYIRKTDFADTEFMNLLDEVADRASIDEFPAENQ